MKRVYFILLTMLVGCMTAHAAKPISVVKQGERLAILTMHDGSQYEYVFERCMANELYTFHTVKVNGVIVNEATSDNIGPLLVENAGWTGGNHLLDNGNRSARTVEVGFMADGKKMEKDKTYNCNRVDIAVKNVLADPRNEDNVLCTEQVAYVVMGNSIDVTLQLSFECKEPCVIDRYYGMQSMMVGEKAVYTPGGAYSDFTRIDDVNRFKQGDYPSFNCFIEQGEKCTQASYLAPEDLGRHTLVADDDVSFIGNSSGKCYHKMMGGTTVQSGDTFKWHGVYVWYVNDFTLRGKYAFKGFYNGEPVIYECDTNGARPLITKNKK